jgi:hypothetical protein
MKQFLLSFLMIVMFTPSLACAMPICADEAQAVKAEIPCADHASGHHGDQKTTSESKAGGLMADCMGVDFQKADTANLDKPDFKGSPVIHALADETSSDLLLYTDASTIRGPPPDWPTLSRTQPSILLTTQRFRI